MAANGHPGEGSAVAPTFAPSGVFADEAAGDAGAGEAQVAKRAGRGRGGGGGGHPCPPQLLRRHVPCKDTTAMDTEAFLAHLQTLSWYKGQVGCTASKGYGKVTTVHAEGCRQVRASMQTLLWRVGLMRRASARLGSLGSAGFPSLPPLGAPAVTFGQDLGLSPSHCRIAFPGDARKRSLARRPRRMHRN